MLQFLWGGVRIIDWIFPPGHILQTTNENYNPNKVFKGTTWTRIKDRFLLSAGDTYSAGNTGGEASHTLTIEEMPSHRHYLKYGGAYIGYLNSNASQSNGEPLYKYNVPRENALHGEDMGGSQPHNNMPPFLTVYTWQRIS